LLPPLLPLLLPPSRGPDTGCGCALPSVVYPRFSVVAPLLAVTLVALAAVGREAVTFVLSAEVDGVALAVSRVVVVAGLAVVLVEGVDAVVGVLEDVAVGRVVVVVEGRAVVVVAGREVVVVVGRAVVEGVLFVVVVEEGREDAC